MEKNIFAERGRALEEEYFRQKDKELVEKMRRAATAADARVEMGKQTGLTDPEMLQELETLGFMPDTVVLLPLVPVVEMAWAEGGVTPAERSLIVRLARARGIQEGGGGGPSALRLAQSPARRVRVHACDAAHSCRAGRPRTRRSERRRSGEVLRVDRRRVGRDAGHYRPRFRRGTTVPRDARRRVEGPRRLAAFAMKTVFVSGRNLCTLCG